MQRIYPAPIPVPRPRSAPHVSVMPAAIGTAALQLVRPHALVVNECRFLTDRVVRALECKGFDCSIATDGYDALTLLHERRHQLVVLDIDVSFVSGMTLLRRLRLDPVHAKVPVLMLGDATAADREQAIALGANAFMSKPLQARPFYAMIDALMGA